MPRRKFFAAAFVILCLLFALCRAGVAESRSPRIRVVTTCYPLYIMALNVFEGVAGVSLENLTPPAAGCLHGYSLTAGERKRLEEASVVVANGAGLEPFLGEIIGGPSGNNVVQLAADIPLRENNPHVWVNPAYAIRQVRNLDRYMEEYDPGHAAQYRHNTEVYCASLGALRQRMHEGLDHYRGRAIITNHNAFPYFAEEFGLTVAGVIEREPGGVPEAAESADIVRMIKGHGLRALFSEPQYPAFAIDVIAQETGNKVFVLDPAVTGPDHPDAYITIMDRNLAALKDALQ